MEIEFLSSEPQEKLIENFVQEEKSDSNKSSTALNTLLIKLAKKETTLISIVRDLQAFLTSTNQTHRTRGCLLLSNIFERFQDLVLESHEFDSLYEFFISKMTDVATTLEALKVIRNLLVRNNKPKKIFQDDKKLFDSFIGVLDSKSFHTPAYSQEVRYIVYDILKIFAQNNENYCIELNDKFVRIVLGAIEEEQDPRNLMVSFKLAHFLLDKMPPKTMELYKNDIFEALSMYYPISFTPPENDVIKITPQDLESELNMCLCHPILIELTMDLVFDKISASQDEAKIACLRTLEQIVKSNFSKTFVAKYGEDLWRKIKMTYYHSISAAAEEACINFLQSFIKQPLNVNVDKGLNSGVLDHIVEKIISSCFLDIQKGSATQNASKSIKILLLISSISEDNSTTILNRFCALFLEKCEIQNISECQAWLEYFYKLYDVWSKFIQGRTDFKGTLFGLKLETFKVTYQRIRDILDSALSNESIKIIALRIYAHTTNLLFKSISYKTGYEYLCQLVFMITQSPMMKECVGDALIIASEGNDVPEVDEAIANVIEIFDKVFCRDEVAEKGSLEDYFSHNPNSMFYYLKTFSSKKQFRGKILSLLLRFLTLHLQKSKVSSEHLIAGVKTLKQIIINMTEEKKKVANPEQFESSEKEIFELLIANSSLEKGLLQFKQADKTKYKALKQDFKGILSQMSSSQDFVMNSFNFFVDVLQKDAYLNADLKLIGWLFEAMSQKSFLAGPKEAISALISTIQTKNVSTREATFALGKILRSFINKTNDNTIQKPLIEYFVKTYKETGELSKLVLYSYTIKGLITRGDMMGFQCLVQFFNTTLPLIQEAKHTDLLITCYKIIIKDLKRDFSEFVISATSKQRLFSIIFPYVYTLYKKGKEENVPEVKEFFTVVIMYLITQIPFKIMKSSFQQILPIILENMSKFKEQFEKQLDNIEYSIDFISKILGEKEETNYEVEDLVDHLLYIVHALREKQSSVSSEFYVRNYSAILKTLLQISKFPLKNPKHLRTEIIETLSVDRDNKKRDIRKYVTRCINVWSVVV